MNTGPVTAYVGLGSNLGDRHAFLQRAIDALAATEGISVTDVSRVYETAPVGGPEQGPYLNAVVALTSDLDPIGFLAVAQAIEHSAQRIRTERWGARTLDIDLLLFGDDQRDTPELTLPHPRLWVRGFVLAPLADVAPGLVTVPDHGWPGVQATDLVLVLASGTAISYEEPA